MKMMAFWMFVLPTLQVGIGNPNRFNNYLMLGYGVMGLIMLGYIVTLAVRQRNLQKDLQLMGQLLQEDEEK
jgi:CcmD family protein